MTHCKGMSKIQATQKLNSWGWLARGLALERNKLIPLRPILAKQSR